MRTVAEEYNMVGRRAEAGTIRRGEEERMGRRWQDECNSGARVIIN